MPSKLYILCDVGDDHKTSTGVELGVYGCAATAIFMVSAAVMLKLWHKLYPKVADRDIRKGQQFHTQAPKRYNSGLKAKGKRAPVATDSWSGRLACHELLAMQGARFAAQEPLPQKTWSFLQRLRQGSRLLAP